MLDSCWCRSIPTAAAYLERGSAGKLGFLAALGGHAGVAGADEDGGADLQRWALARRVDHAVEGVEGGGDGERPQALPPGVGRLGERRRVRALRLGSCHS